LTIDRAGARRTETSRSGPDQDAPRRAAKQRRRRPLGAPFTDFALDQPSGIAADRAGNVFVSNADEE
jgi:pSer/pThr/pTyr-binding forkhead associated (FHA) protein